MTIFLPESQPDSEPTSVYTCTGNTSDYRACQRPPQCGSQQNPEYEKLSGVSDSMSPTGKLQRIMKDRRWWKTSSAVGISLEI